MNTEIMDRYKKRLYASEKSSKTIEAYMSDIKLFSQFINKPLQETNFDDVDNWLYSIIKLAPKTKNRKIKAIRQMFSYMVKRKMIDENPFEDTKTFKEPKREVITFTKEDVEEIEFGLRWNTRNPKRNLCLFLTQIETGLRIEELLSLHTDNFIIKDNHVELRIIGKGNKERQFPINQRTYDRILDYIGDKVGKIFDISTDEYRRVLKTQIKKRLGGKEFYNVTHNCRSYFISKLINAGTPLTTVAEICGHSSIEQLKSYAMVSEDDKLSAMKNV